MSHARQPLTTEPFVNCRRLQRVLARVQAAIKPGVEGGQPRPFRAHRFGHDHEHDTIDLEGDKSDVLDAYREQAESLHEQLVHERDISVAEFLGATGSGKTLILERILERAPDDERIGVVVGDVAGDDDAARLRGPGVRVTTINTGKECHLDPTLVEEGIEAFDLDSLDRLYLENVGNMVCPADFPLGAQARVLVVSTTEGDDVVHKHPLLFQACDAAVVNKTDIADAVDADVDRMTDDVAEVAPEMPVFRTSAKSGEGMDELVSFLTKQRERGHAVTDNAHAGRPVDMTETKHDRVADENSD